MKTVKSNKEATAAKTETTKPTTKVENLGRAALVHKLHVSKTPKAKALEVVRAKFTVSPSLFERIWARSARGKKVVAKAVKPEAKKKSTAAPVKTEIADNGAVLNK